MTPILEINNLTKAFGGVVAINDVSFQVQKGEILGLIGPNGAGKTTVLNCISSLMPITSGEIKFDNQNITGMKSNEIARLGVGRTFQVVKPFTGMTVAENVTIGALFGSHRPNRSSSQVNELMERVLALTALDTYKDAYVTDLPIAFRKRLELARALAMEPKILLLDEVMAGLTPTEVDSALELIGEIRDLGITIVMIEHVMRAIMCTCNRVVVLREGKLIADGTPQEVTQDEQVIRAYLGDRWAENIRQQGGAEQLLC